jgi:hypothetical protein
LLAEFDGAADRKQNDGGGVTDHGVVFSGLNVEWS